VTSLWPPDHDREAATQADGRGDPCAALRTTSTSSLIMGSPARRLNNPITGCRAPAPFRYAGTDDERGTRHMLDVDRLTLVSGRSARRFAALVLDQPTVDLARALVPCWMEDPRSGEANGSEDDKRRNGDRDLDRSGSVHGTVNGAVPTKSRGVRSSAR
jgi:hypothetical protein